MYATNVSFNMDLYLSPLQRTTHANSRTATGTVYLVGGGILVVARLNSFTNNSSERSACVPLFVLHFVRCVFHPPTFPVAVNQFQLEICVLIINIYI
jgi:hypothetical protein